MASIILLINNPNNNPIAQEKHYRLSHFVPDGHPKSFPAVLPR